MNAGRLIELFERVGEAPGAVERLRAFVCDLALAGALGGRGADAALVAAMSRRIAQRTANSSHQPATRKTSTLRTPESDAPPFRAPKTWSWERLVDIAQVSYGFAFPSAGFSAQRRGIPLIRIRDIASSDTQAYFDGPYDKAYLVHAGDVLVGMDGDFNAHRWKGPPALLNQRVMRISRWHHDVNVDFVMLPLQRVLDHLHAHTSQTTVKHLSAKQVSEVKIPLPPPEEQSIIAERVRELMALCDQLESVQAERERRRDRLVTASLQRLREPVEDGAVFREQAAFHLRHMGRMTTRVEHVREMREAVLAMAVRGMLSTRQSQYTATDLLQRVAVQMEEAERQGSIKPRETAAPVSEEEVPYRLPVSWRWARFQNVAAIQSNLVNPREFMSLPLIAPDNIEASTGRLLQYGSTEAADVRSGKHRFQPGVLLYSKIRPALNKVVSVDFEGLCSADMYPVLPFIDRRYLQFFMLSDVFLRQSVAHANRVAMPKINQEALNHIVVAVPPLDEQEYIVERVDQLLAYCDELAMALVELAQHRVTLLDAAINQALVATSSQATE